MEFALKFKNILSRCWLDGGTPPENARTRVGRKVNGVWLDGGSIAASPRALDEYFEEREGDSYFSPAIDIDGAKLTSSIAFDIDSPKTLAGFEGFNISPFLTVHTGSGDFHEHLYIALDRVYSVLDIKPVALALNRIVGSDGGCSGDYRRRWGEGFNYKTTPPAPVSFELHRLRKYSIRELENKAGILTLSSEPLQKRRSISTGERLDNFSRDIDPVFSGKLRRLLSRDHRLSRLYAGLSRVYPSTSEASFAFATALLWRGIERGEILKVLLTWPLGIIASHRKQTQGALYDRARGIIEGADIELSKQGWTREKRLIWIHGRKDIWIPDQKLWKLTGLSGPDYRRGLDSLIEAGRAEIKQGRYRAGKNARRVVKLHSENQLFAANDYE